VSFDALRMFYSGAEAFVFPSLYEGFGLPPLEAMATGVPVVAASTSSLPEVVGDAAELVNPDNVFDIVRGMREVLLHTSYRQQLIERGHEQVRKFDWDTTAAQIREVYRDVAARARN
jgi:glycosyltransferase involved in cell wall biosynthesis